MIALAGVFLAVFYFVERRADEPIIPLDLFRLSLFRTSATVATLAAMGVFGAISYLPLYLQGVAGLTASRAGMILLFLSVAWTAGSLIAGQLLNRVGYRASAATGMFLLAAGYGLFVVFKSDLNVFWVAVSGTLIGTGMGWRTSRRWWRCKIQSQPNGSAWRLLPSCSFAPSAVRLPSVCWL
jgi:predicted MFS family arabinose efflux permease